MKPFPGVMKRQENGGRPYILTDEQREWFFRWFPTIENGRISKAMGISTFTARKLARTFGLKKSKKGMHSIRLRQAKAAVKTCERNGYYDSIRGKSPSEETLKAVRKRWESIRRGDKDDPISAMRKKNPKRYQEWVENKRVTRIELIRKERLRAKYGLKRQTKLHMVALYPYTHSQVSHRHNALKRGYLLDEDCREGQPGRYVIYYDEKTNRSEKFEANCIKDGFRFEPD